MIKAGILGSTGYAGQELARILLRHPEVQIVWYGSRSHIGEEYGKIFGNLFEIADGFCRGEEIGELADEADVVFCAAPQGFCASFMSEDVLGRTRVIDLSADFRIKDISKYEKWYGIKHPSAEFAREAVYGLCEINREEIKKARLVANPGCYPTCSTLSIYPLAKEGLIDMRSIIIDAKSGVSGAGRGAKESGLFCEVNESIKPYAPGSHRHTPEIEDNLTYASGEDAAITFTPHLVPMNRGILSTSYASLKKKATYGEIRSLYDKYYKDEYFVRVLDEGSFPETRWVEGGNFADLGFKIDERTGRVIMMGAIDNLIKGAAGQAVQNMNIMFGLEEREGLMEPPIFP